MTRERLTVLCRENFGTDVEVFHCEAKNSSGEARMSWPQHLERTFDIRLRGCRECGSDPALVREIERFLRLLRTMSSEAPLWVWQARSASSTFSGWADVEQIIFGFPGPNIEQGE
jgi:hypothetical protein